MVNIALCTLCQGAHFVIMPTAYSNLFGDYASLIYGFGFTFNGLSYLLSMVLLDAFLDSAGYSSFYYLSGAMSVTALLMLSFFNDSKFKFE